MPAISRDHAFVCDCSFIDDGQDRSIFALGARPDSLCLGAVFVLLHLLAPGNWYGHNLLEMGVVILNKIAASHRIAAA